MKFTMFREIDVLVFNEKNIKNLLPLLLIFFLIITINVIFASYITIPSKRLMLNTSID